MEAPTGTQSAPYTAYGLRQEHDSRWELIEPLPTDPSALEAELQRLDATLAALDNDTDTDFVTGAMTLATQKRSLEVQAHARYDRVAASVAMLCEHECAQARTRYATRCEQLKLDMGEAIQREIQRLQRARDGVAVMDRRRLKRHSGNNNNNSGMGNGTGGGGSDLGGGAYDANGTADGLASGHPVTEKRRMEVLLSATPIFRRLDKTLSLDQVDSDLTRIHEAMPTFLYDDLESAEDIDEESDAEEARELEELRNQSGGNTFKRRRLLYNADRVPEGHHVVVYRMASTPAKKVQNKNRPHGSRDDESETNQRQELMTGVITAATGTQVYLLTPDGSFQTLLVDDWKTGRITVHTVDNPSEN